MEAHEDTAVSVATWLGNKNLSDRKTANPNYAYFKQKFDEIRRLGRDEEVLAFANSFVDFLSVKHDASDIRNWLMLRNSWPKENSAFLDTGKLFERLETITTINSLPGKVNDGTNKTGYHLAWIEVFYLLIHLRFLSPTQFPNDSDYFELVAEHINFENYESNGSSSKWKLPFWNLGDYYLGPPQTKVGLNDEKKRKVVLERDQFEKLLTDLQEKLPEESGGGAGGADGGDEGGGIDEAERLAEENNKRAQEEAAAQEAAREAAEAEARAAEEERQRIAREEAAQLAAAAAAEEEQQKIAREEAAREAAEAKARAAEEEQQRIAREEAAQVAAAAAAEEERKRIAREEEAAAAKNDDGGDGDAGGKDSDSDADERKELLRQLQELVALNEALQTEINKRAIEKGTSGGEEEEDDCETRIADLNARLEDKLQRIRGLEAQLSAQDNSGGDEKSDKGAKQIAQLQAELAGAKERIQFLEADDGGDETEPEIQQQIAEKDEEIEGLKAQLAAALEQLAAPVTRPRDDGGDGEAGSKLDVREAIEHMLYLDSTGSVLLIRLSPDDEKGSAQFMAVDVNYYGYPFKKLVPQELLSENCSPVSETTAINFLRTIRRYVGDARAERNFGDRAALQNGTMKFCLPRNIGTFLRNEQEESGTDTFLDQNLAEYVPMIAEYFCACRERGGIQVQKAYRNLDPEEDTGKFRPRPPPYGDLRNFTILWRWFWKRNATLEVLEIPE